MVPKGSDHTQVIVLKCVPKIAHLRPEQVQPGADVPADVSFRLGKPVGRDFRSLERTTGGFFGDVDRLLQHYFLPGMQPGREPGIPSRERIIADPKIHAAVSGQKNRIARNETVMDPARRSAEADSEKKKGDGT